MDEQDTAYRSARIFGSNRNDNFFDLGGDSIRSIQIVAQANQAGLKLIPRHLFRHQTIAELAAALEPSPAPQAGREDSSGEDVFPRR